LSKGSKVEKETLKDNHEITKIIKHEREKIFLGDADLLDSHDINAVMK
jgi:hypothetical protein